jgi:putative MATE family efflux protein
MPAERKTFKALSIWKGEVDLTTGNLFKKMVIFTLPVILTSLIQLLYTSADLFVVAHWGGGNYSMAAVGDNGSLINLIVNTFVAVSVGANVVMARYRGAKDAEHAEKALDSAMVIALILGVVVSAFGYFMAHYFLEWMNTPSQIIDLAAVYLRIYFIGVPFLMIFNFGSAILRANGDSKRPLYALVLCGLINIGLNFLFVLAFHMDVDGVAWTTVISEALEAILVIVFLTDKKYGFVRLHLSNFRPYKKETGEILRNGLPAGAESLIFSISNVLIQAVANTYDASAIAGNTASDNLEGYIFCVLEAFAVAVSSVAAQNYGANNKENLRKTLVYSFLSIGVLGLTLGGLAAIFRRQLIGIFLVDNGDASFNYDEAMMVGTNRLMLMGLTYILCAFMDVFSGYLRGLGHWLAPTLVTFLCACLVRIVYVFALYNNIPAMQTLTWLYAAYPFTWTLADLTYLFLVPPLQKEAYAAIDARLAEFAHQGTPHGKETLAA